MRYMGKMLVFAFLLGLPWWVRAETAREKCMNAYTEQVNAYAGLGVDGTPNRFLSDVRDECLRAAGAEDDANAERCVNEAKRKITEACLPSFTAASNTCDVAKLKGVTIKKDEIESTEGVGAATDKVATVAGEAKDAYTKFSVTCEPAQKKCVDECQAAKAQVESCGQYAQGDAGTLNEVRAAAETLNPKITTCQGLVSKIAEAKKGAKVVDEVEKEADRVGDSTGGSTGGGGAQAASADGKKGSGGGGMPSMPNFGGMGGDAQAASTPVTATASQGCDNPSNTDRVCQCLRNPAMCQQASSSSSREGLSSTNDYSSTSSAGAASNLDTNLGGNNFSGVSGMNPAGSSSEVGGKQGNGAAVSGENAFSGAPSGGRSGSNSAPDYNSKIHSGFYGAANSGGRGGGGGSASAASSQSVVRGTERPDLTKFLPGGNLDPKRGPSSIVGKDGITGPNDFNWDKMHKQFQRLWREGDNFLAY